MGKGTPRSRRTTPRTPRGAKTPKGNRDSKEFLVIDDVLTAPIRALCAVAKTPNDTDIWVGCEDGNVFVCEPTTGLCIRHFQSTHLPINDMIVASPNTIWGAVQNKVYVWDFRTIKLLRTMLVVEDEARSLSCLLLIRPTLSSSSASSSLSSALVAEPVVWGAAGAEIFVWTAAFQRIQELNLQMPVVQMTQLGERVLVASRSSLLLVDIASFSRVARWDAHTQRITSAVASGGLAWSAAKDKLICVWSADVAQEQGPKRLVKALRHHTKKVTCVCAASPSDAVIAAAAASMGEMIDHSGEEDSFSVRSRSGSRARARVHALVDGVAAAAASNVILDVWSASDDESVILWDGTTLKEKVVFDALPVVVSRLAALPMLLDGTNRVVGSVPGRAALVLMAVGPSAPDMPKPKPVAHQFSEPVPSKPVRCGYCLRKIRTEVIFCLLCELCVHGPCARVVRSACLGQPHVPGSDHKQRLTTHKMLSPRSAAELAGNATSQSSADPGVAESGEQKAAKKKKGKASSGEPGSSLSASAMTEKESKSAMLKESVLKGAKSVQSSVSRQQNSVANGGSMKRKPSASGGFGLLSEDEAAVAARDFAARYLGTVRRLDADHMRDIDGRLGALLRSDEVRKLFTGSSKDERCVELRQLKRTILHSIEPLKRALAALPVAVYDVPLRVQYSVTCASVQGAREYMEDRYTIIEHPHELFGVEKLYNGDRLPPTVYFGVFDGHTGARAAQYAATHLLANILCDPAYTKGDPMEAMRSAFVKTDRAFNALSEAHDFNDGTTAVVVLLRDEKLYCAWVGDSEALLYRSGHVKLLTRKHTPELKDEKQRIQELGGSVAWNGTWRVNQSIAVTRSIGDRDMSHLVISDPEVVEVALEPEDQWILVGSDGLFDVFQMEELGNFCQRWLETHGLPTLCQALVDEALRRNSKDNVTALFISLTDFHQ